MKLLNIFKQIVKEYVVTSNYGDYEIVDLLSPEEAIEKYYDVKEFYDTMNTTPKREVYDIDPSKIGNINPFRKGTWAYYKWYTFYKPNREDNCKKNLTLRKKAANAAEKIHPDVEVYFGDDDC
tara:strand:- start:1618 stop:1986 length:369 start_codon:yes stop_codon:yes gene_type:complete